MNQDLNCYETLESSDISLGDLSLDNLPLFGEDLQCFLGGAQSMAELSYFQPSDTLLKYPESLDSWSCCQERWTRYSNIIDHIEHHHYLYKRKVVNNSGEGLLQGFPYKYQCDTCSDRHFTFFAAITHFLKEHVEHHIFCLQCLVLHNPETYHTHIHECNVVQDYVASNGKHH